MRSEKCTRVEWIDFAKCNKGYEQVAFTYF